MLLMILLDWIFRVMNISYLPAGGGEIYGQCILLRSIPLLTRVISDLCQNRWVSFWNRFVTYAV